MSLRTNGSDSAIYESASRDEAYQQDPSARRTISEG